MGFFSTLFGGGAAAKEKIRAEINLADAVQAHIHWKLRLENYVNGKSDEALDPLVIARDDQCDLGKWINGPGLQAFHDNKEFLQLRDNHAQFHYLAANVVKHVQDKDTAGAHALLTGQYAAISHKVVAELTDLNKEIAE